MAAGPGGGSEGAAFDRSALPTVPAPMREGGARDEAKVILAPQETPAPSRAGDDAHARGGGATSKPPKTVPGIGAAAANGGSVDTGRFGAAARPAERGSSGRIRLAAENAARGTGVDEGAEHANDESHQLFDRWEKEGLAAHESVGVEEEEADHDVIARTPEQEARRAWFLRFVAGLVGFLAVIGGFAFFRSRTESTSVRSDPGPSLGPAPTAAPTAGPALTTPPIVSARPVETLPVASAKTPEVAPATSGASTPTPPALAADNAHRLPLVDVEVPASPDAATTKLWEVAAKRLNDRDFKGADAVLAELGKKADRATRESARLARAIWWINNGKQTEVRPVIADLANNAATPSVQKRARELAELR
jgi:hypothetical protein